MQLFHPSSLHFGVASMGTKCELHEEHLSASDDEEDHQICDVFLNLVTSFDFGARIQSNLADEERGRVGLAYVDTFGISVHFTFLRLRSPVLPILALQ